MNSERDNGPHRGPDLGLPRVGLPVGPRACVRSCSERSWEGRDCSLVFAAPAGHCAR